MIREPSQPKAGENLRSTTANRPPGTLFIVGTPIGSPRDITLRAVDILKQVAVVAAETPLVTQTFLARHGIGTTITSYGPRNYQEKIALLLRKISDGHDVALVSDSGMPVIYDPGRLLIAAAHKAKLPVSVIPGPSALTAAIALSGYLGNRLVFEGSLPHRRPQLQRLLASFEFESRPVVLFLHPGSLRSVMQSIARTLPARTVTVAADLTTPHEIIYQGKPAGLVRKLVSLRKEAEVTLVLRGTVKRRRSGKTAKRRRVEGSSRRDGG
ncbi:MAG: 16S rRNA (cytidine(1402)-2'-O)-methyltransferase [Nitrospira sp. CR1.3]|nr:16S rRNA (cytidine(1402)-2'-O)-methyltransferase [Nitrospira sp. CR1.3]